MFDNATYKSVPECGSTGTPRATSWDRIITVSNRLPFKVEFDTEHKPVLRPGAGGLVTAMRPLLRHGIAGKWVGWPGEVDEEALEEVLRSGSAERIKVGAVRLSAQDVDLYYRGYSNEVLAPVLAGESDKFDLRKACDCWFAYRRVQAKFARKICDDLRSGDMVWIHDYHLTGVARQMRLLKSMHLIGFFLHMPFPSKEEFRVIPQYRLLLQDLLAYDIIGFQTMRFRNNFLGAIRAYEPEATVSVGQGDVVQVHFRGNMTRLGYFPVSIDVSEFERQLYLPKTQLNLRRLKRVIRANGDPKIILNVGRQDYSKGFLEELRAFELLLERHPELIGNVVLYQLVIPSRGLISAHRRYKDEIIALAKRINRRFGTVVRQSHTHMSRVRYLAYLHAADVQSVPTRSDGMNLVAKESAIIGNPATVLILGKNAGVAEELGEYALLIDPVDIDAFADVMYGALRMPEAERRRRKSRMKGAVTANDVFNWWYQQELIFQRVWDEKCSG